MKSTHSSRPLKGPHGSVAEHQALRFPTQRPNEHVVLLLRRNWTVLARDVIQLTLSIILPPIIVTLVFYFTEFSFSSSPLIYILTVEGLSLYYLFCLLAYFHDFVDYHLDIWVVTDLRIVSIEQNGLFKRVISELNILKVQDVTAEVNGKVQTFLDYGQVYIQTAGQQERFIFEQVPHPAEITKIILQVHDRAAKAEELERVKESEEYRHKIDEGLDAKETPLSQSASPSPVNKPQPSPAKTFSK